MPKSKKTKKPAAKKTPRRVAKKTPAISGGTIVGGTDPCVCGRSPEEHGRDPNYPGSTGCVESGCIAYEADPADEES